MDKEIVDSLITGVKNSVYVEKLEEGYEKLLERVKNLKCTKASQVDKEIAIIDAEITLSSIREVRSKI